MANHLPGNRSLLKDMNRSLLLNTIRREGALSRTQLMETSGLSGGAVSNIVNELLSERWILPAGEGDYTGGRRQTPLRLNPQAGYAVGIKLMEDRMVSAITDFQATILHAHEHHFSYDDDPQRIAMRISQVLQEDIARSGVDAARLLGVGIGLAGIVDAQSGVVRHSPFFGWQDVSLAALVAARSRRPVFVENDVNTLTLTEQLFGAGRHQKNFVVITVGRGIGMGMVINGQLYHGSRGGAGEFGHIVLLSPTDEERTLEESASDPAVLATLNAQRTAGAAYATIDEVAAAASAGDPAAQAALAQSGALLGKATANVINVFVPDLLIISGEGVAAGPYRLDAMERALREHAFAHLLDDVQILIRETGDQDWARGAAGLVLSKAFVSPVIQSDGL
ncbi:MAG: ROK family transcriptional regulator [Caldilineaceae bacterium]|nr:ROK family transcriptional regulator [Caldilineaceae bacterium]